MPDIKQEIAEYINGTCHSEHEVAESFGVDADFVLEAVVEHGVERCDGCGWWCDIDELNADMDCADCEEPDDEEH